MLEYPPLAGLRAGNRCAPTERWAPGLPGW